MELKINAEEATFLEREINRRDEEITNLLRNPNASLKYIETRNVELGFFRAVKRAILSGEKA